MTAISSNTRPPENKKRKLRFSFSFYDKSAHVFAYLVNRENNSKWTKNSVSVNQTRSKNKCAKLQHAEKSRWVHRKHGVKLITSRPQKCNIIKRLLSTFLRRQESLHKGERKVFSSFFFCLPESRLQTDKRVREEIEIELSSSPK